ncbi:uncharacterized protein LOC119337195 isoform X2 [Triticum dicoccoides]|uniref:uncharacterized protein LOC119337195 isoform X2 n=1 Tax=Triticum dicoccoides TaxID=85692 RepID=UPI0018914E1B|nr:uncharacterized protein LOC119337195 isoform X2 [Triticum dicoccoides]
MVLEEIVKQRKRQLVHELASGVVVEVYQFTHDMQTWKTGKIFNPTDKKRALFGIGARGNSILNFTAKGRDAKFLVDVQGKKHELEDMMDQSFKVKHTGILKPYFTVLNDDLGMMVTGFSSWNVSFVDWLQKQTAQPGIAGRYLSAQEMDILITIYKAIDEIWRNGYTSDHLADQGSYVFIDSRIKILPSVIRLQNPADVDFMVLRNAFADMIQNHLSPVWPNPELIDFILLLRNGVAGTKDILDHPILLAPKRRQLLYQSLYIPNMSINKATTLKQQIPVIANWQTTVPQHNRVLASIFNGQTFANDTCGELHFASVTSCHYLQHLKRLRQCVGVLL